MSIPNQITIDSTNSTVTVQTDENLLLITNVAHSTQITPPKSNQIVVEASPVNIDIQTPDKSIFTYNETPIVEVDVIQPVTKVIQVANVGPQGPVGPMGPMGPPGIITAASGLIVTGSIFVSGSPGSVIATSFTGSLFGTSSWAVNAQTASYAVNLRVSGSITDVDYIDFDTTATVTQPTQARLSWNNTDGTLDLGLKGGNVKLEIGQTEVVRVVNKTNTNLLQSQYKVVRIRRSNEGGAQGQRLAVVLAQANNDPNSVDTIGLVAENININQEGFIVSSGLVKNINTTSTGPYGENWMDGDVLYLSPTTAGALTNIKPQAPNHTVIVGFVVYAHQNNGKIFVKVDNGYEIDELHNVRINTASLSTGDLLTYNSSSGYWQNSKQLSGSYGLIGSLTATSFTGSFSGSIRAPGSTTQLIFNNNGVLAGTSNITYANNNLLSINTSQTTIGGFTHIINDTLASQGSPQLIVGDGSGDASYYAIIPKIYTSKGEVALGQKAFASRQTAVEGRQVQEFFIETGIIDGKPSTGTESTILTLTDQERVGIGTIDPRAKLEVLGSVLISGSNTLTNIGPAVFSGSVNVTQGNATLEESLYVIKKVSIGTTHQSASLTISASSADDALLVKLDNNNGDPDKFKINNEGIAVLGALDSSPTPVAGGIYFSLENDYFFGFS